MFAADVLEDAAARGARFPDLFAAQARIRGHVDTILDQHQAQVRDGEEPVVLVIGPSLAKALKTFEGIRTLCLLGLGEDAIVLLRTNINLLINLGYILAAPGPAERALDFIADSYRRREEYRKEAHGLESPAGNLAMTEEEKSLRSKRWAGTTIKSRAASVPPFHYTVGYRLYSSFEHSDAAALDGYFSRWDETGLEARSLPSDDHIGIVLTHSVIVLADLLRLYCQYFRIERPDVFKTVLLLVESLGRRDGSEEHAKREGMS